MCARSTTGRFFSLYCAASPFASDVVSSPFPNAKMEQGDDAPITRFVPLILWYEKNLTKGDTGRATTFSLMSNLVLRRKSPRINSKRVG